MAQLAAAEASKKRPRDLASYAERVEPGLLASATARADTKQVAAAKVRLIEVTKDYAKAKAGTHSTHSNVSKDARPGRRWRAGGMQTAHGGKGKNEETGKKTTGSEVVGRTAAQRARASEAKEQREAEIGLPPKPSTTTIPHTPPPPPPLGHQPPPVRHNLLSFAVVTEWPVGVYPPRRRRSPPQCP